ncbi:MAG: pyruvate:ferredoxin (flavodoxin) oxidoreductase [Acidimicrobiia bacterium]|nr:pyruvate:ferredoxin (flavodoxin) oxidoreductase [Acidimicrobiia bacterium]
MTYATIDGNEAAARVAHALSEVIAIYPITPASPMGELADAWSMAGRKNVWGDIPDVIEMQSEAGAAGSLHGALQAGALTTTFTASQGLLLMIPNLYKIAGELTAAVVHVAARTVATHALSIFGDHSDVMAVRQTGMAMLASGSVQEAHDLALVAHAATLRARVPFIHFFDGFRTSHEVAKVSLLDTGTMTSMIDDALVDEHRKRGLNPNAPVLRGTAQNPDVFFQAREASNPYHDAVPDLVQHEMDTLASLTGRAYRLFDYVGHPEADRIVVLMGSGSGPVREVVEAGAARGERIGAIIVRLYRPFSATAFADALPRSVTSIAVLDRTKEPGAVGEPLYQDVLTALVESGTRPLPRVIGGRYGLSSKEFTPAMVLSVFDELQKDTPLPHFTVGIVDDISHLSLQTDNQSWSEPQVVSRAVFYGLGADGTVGANKNSVKIIGEETDLFAQGYFVYDSKKSGSRTISHLRFGPDPIYSSYLIEEADFVACHNFGFLERFQMLDIAAPGATFLLNSPYPADEVWRHLPSDVQSQLIDKQLEMWVIDANRIAREAGLGGRINTVLQTCFFGLANIIEPDQAIAAIKTSIQKTYGKRGRAIVDRNWAVVDASLDGLERVALPTEVMGGRTMRPVVPPEAAVERVTAAIMAGTGDLLPVSALPVDGTFETGSAQWEKRTIAAEIPVWDPEICIDCARCALVCPHAAIRIKVVENEEVLNGAPGSFKSKIWEKSEAERLIVQVAPDDCTGCGVCVSICPAKSKEVAKHKAIDMEPITLHLDDERDNFDFFLSLPEYDRTRIRLDSVKGSQLAQPLFEFSGACAGCGETPYLKLMSQLFGDRIVVANATGCSSIYGGNLPTTPWSKNAGGRGPAWSNSLFEDNAEFGLGMRLAFDHHARSARHLLEEMEADIGQLATDVLAADQSNEAGINQQRDRVEELRRQLSHIGTIEATRLGELAEYLVTTGVWIVGGDGWVYDIGFGGLDHVLASGRNVNILVLDTEVYSNTGGQTSKATPRAATAKFSAGGKTTAKKDLGMIAMGYGGVYVAQIAMGANMTQTIKAFVEAEAHPGPSLIIAYSPCIAHGYDLGEMAAHQKMAAESGYWPLYRFDPGREDKGDHALHLDSRKPRIPFKEFASTEARFAMLARSQPEVAARLFEEAQRDIDDRWHLYEQMVLVERTARFGDLEE